MDKVDKFISFLSDSLLPTPYAANFVHRRRGQSEGHFIRRCTMQRSAIMKVAVEPERFATDFDYLLSSEFAHPKVIAAEIGMSRRRLDELHRQGSGPPRIRIGGKIVLYSRRSVREWLMQREERQRRR